MTTKEMETRLSVMEKQISDVHGALLGDEFGNKGYKQRLAIVEKKLSVQEKKGFILYGITATIGFIVSKWKVITDFFSGN